MDADGWTAPGQAISSCNDDFYLCVFFKFVLIVECYMDLIEWVFSPQFEVLIFEAD